MEKILVTDAQMRSSLAVIRSLGKKGLDITAGEDTRFATGFFSKYCQNHIVYPSPQKEPKAFVKYMLKVVKNNSYRSIFPVTDHPLMPLAEYKTDFSKHTILPFPDYETLIKGRDKGQTLRIAMENDISCPKTYFIDNLEDLETIKNKLEYPVLLKPRKSSGSRGLVLCTSQNELIEKYKRIYAKYGAPLIQDYIPEGGDEIGVYTLFNFDSKPRAVVVQRRIRSYPISGGPSTLRETIKSPELVKIAFKLLKSMEWQGVAMVEFKVDPRDGVPKLMEVNPRFWGSLQLSILAGVDFPYLLYKLVIEGDVNSSLEYKEGVKCRWVLPGDVLWFLSSPNKKKNLPEFLKFRNMNYDILSWDDPGPTFGFMLATARYLFDKDMRRHTIRGPIDKSKSKSESEIK